MRCYICDVRLSKDEIKYNKNHKRYDPCHTCKEAAGTVFADEDTISFDELILLLEKENNEDVPQPEGCRTGRWSSVN